MYDMAETSSKKRVFELENGNKLHAIQSDPYGFWTLHLDKGQLPERFLGQYTTWDAVVKDVERYQTLRDMAIVEVKPISKATRPDGK
jgi:hypothetical protein